MEYCRDHANLSKTLADVKLDLTTLKTQFQEFKKFYERTAADSQQIILNHFEEVKSLQERAFESIGNLPCGVRMQEITQLDVKVAANNAKISILQILVIVVIIGGIVLGLWIKSSVH